MSSDSGSLEMPFRATWKRWSAYSRVSDRGNQINQFEWTAICWVFPRLRPGFNLCRLSVEQGWRSWHDCCRHQSDLTASLSPRVAELRRPAAGQLWEDEAQIASDHPMHRSRRTDGSSQNLNWINFALPFAGVRCGCCSLAELRREKVQPEDLIGAPSFIVTRR